MTQVGTTLDQGMRGADPNGSPPTQKVGIPVVVTLVEAPACHLCEDAKSVLAVLGQSYAITVTVLSMGDEPGRGLMDWHRAPMSPLVLLDGKYFSSGRLPRRKLERRLAESRHGKTDA